MGFYDMMSGWGGEWTMYLGMIVFWVGAVALVIWGVRALAGPGAAHADLQGPQPLQETAANVFKRRYAAGEIDAAEFEEKRRDLF